MLEMTTRNWKDAWFYAQKIQENFRKWAQNWNERKFELTWADMSWHDQMYLKLPKTTVTDNKSYPKLKQHKLTEAHLKHMYVILPKEILNSA